MNENDSCLDWIAVIFCLAAIAIAIIVIFTGGLPWS
jgi:hypothetical protein